MATLQESQAKWTEKVDELRRMNVDFEEDLRKRKCGFEASVKQKEEELKALEENIKKTREDVETLQEEKAEMIKRLEQQRDETYRMHGFRYDIPDRQERLIVMYEGLYEKAMMIFHNTATALSGEGKRHREGVDFALLCLAKTLRSALQETVQLAKVRLQEFERQLDGQLSVLLEPESSSSAHHSKPPVSAAQKQVALDILRQGVLLSTESGAIDESGNDAPPSVFTVEELQLFQRYEISQLWKRLEKVKKHREDERLQEREFKQELTDYFQLCTSFAWNLILSPFNLFLDPDYVPVERSRQQSSKWAGGVPYRGDTDLNVWPALVNGLNGIILVRRHFLCSQQQQQ